MMQIPDPIHGYIELNSMFARIVNTVALNLSVFKIKL
jgi:HD superfamily phosphohydrolase